MFDQLTRKADIPGRMLMAAIFILAGIGKITAFESTEIYMESFGVPGILLVPTIAFEIGVGTALFLGLGTRYVALPLAVFTLVSGFIFHGNFSEQTQLTMFLKNLAITGGLLLMAKHGAEGLAIETVLMGRLKN